MAPTAAQISGLTQLFENLRSVIIGKEEVIARAVVALIARGHLLIEDVPGIGKTLLGLSLARSIDASFRRIQFTNDLLPADILGLNIFNQNAQHFEFQRGPIFAQIILADEINRSTPKTQSALLEAMNEGQVSIDGKTYPLERPFMVIATENPVEYHGTFPLPEAQLDRFLMRVQIGYPSPADEQRILLGGDLQERMSGLKPVLHCDEVTELQNQADSVRVDDTISSYVVAIANRTRGSDRVKLGMSPRGSQALLQAAKASALIKGRDYCVPDDVKETAGPVIAHRIVMDSAQHGLARVEESETYVQEVLREVPAPQ